MVKIFRSMEIIEEEKPSREEIEFPLKIESVRFVKGAYDCGKTDGLFLILKNDLLLKDTERFYYGFVGKKIHDAFIDDMGLNNVYSLNGKYVRGYLGLNGLELDGLSPYFFN
jgi:hypothetical protein